MSIFSPTSRRKDEPMPDKPFHPRTPPRLHSDPEMEAALFSAKSMVELRERLASTESERDSLIAERETWKARCIAFEQQTQALERELRGLRGFAFGMTGRFKDVSTVLVGIMNDAEAMRLKFLSEDQAGTPDHGRPLPSFLKAEHLKEHSGDDKRERQAEDDRGSVHLHDLGNADPSGPRPPGSEGKV